MKRIATLFTALSLVAFAINAQTAETTTQASNAEITFEKTNHDFGKIPQGTPVTYEFRFTNTGTEPLIVSNVEKVCGCTVTGWTKNPVLPGQTGYVSAQYNAARPGPFKKPVTVISNAKNNPIKLYFEGEVIDKTTDPSGTPTNTDNPLVNPSN
jgi:hypothetical protein